MVFVKYFWGFDSSTEGWTGSNVKWEEGGKGGFPTGHLYGSNSAVSPSSGNVYITVVFKSPRNITINSGDIICLLLSYNVSGTTITGKSLNKVTIEVVDENENVVWSKSVSSGSSAVDTIHSCIVKLGGSGVGINVKVTIFIHTYTVNARFYGYVRLDSVTIYNQPDQIIHTPIPSTLQATVTHEIPINKSGSFVIGALRLDAIQDLTTYNEKLIYDTSNEYDYSDKITKVATCSSSVDKVTITHNADQTLQVYYECDHAIWLLDSNTYEPRWLALIKCYHNQNLTNPDTVSFSTTLNNTTYTDTKSLSFKFVANKLFNVVLTPERDVSGDTSGITKLTATIIVKDANGNVIGQCNYDVLNDSYDNKITIDKSYDNQDLTIEVTINAEGKVSETVTVKLKLNISFEY